jgi:hypothetical protein
VAAVPGGATHSVHMTAPHLYAETVKNKKILLEELPVHFHQQHTVRIAKIYNCPNTLTQKL